MMFTLIRVIIVTIVLGVSGLNAQDFQGVATYKTKRKVDLKIDSTHTSLTPEVQKQMTEMLKKQFERTYILTFNKEESVYREDEELSSPQPQMATGGVMIKTLGGGGSDILYKNTREGSFINQNELLGKMFLIKDQLEVREWKLESDTKFIGEYSCYKATYTEEIEIMEANFGDGPEDEEPKTRTETRTVTAWYTSQIPVNNGPEQYQGLPGLILELNDGNQQIVCSKIVLNPEDKVTIKKPTQGKEVNQEEFDEISEEKMKEMQEQFRARRGDGGSTMQIRIGG
ncbi:GLPGLI family protein [Winogradskyella aurantiaca]|uniref:GLPGLI family protein n=1 Tax=Winogradskyella aurantiaca TaxID=2219558 RepID=UPI001E2FD8BE|nr:GLPGLI family protein [Winogradskyella aurantiaca]